MNESNGHDADDVDRFLATSISATDATLRSTVLNRTSRLVRRRRHVRRLGIVVALGMCFLAGMATMRWSAPPSIRERIVLVPQPAPTPLHSTPKLESPTVPMASTAVAMEYQALDSSRNRAELYRKAGDRYLQQEGDTASAVRCYRHIVDESKVKDLTISPDDNWLLMALKEAKRKETGDETNGN
jgi:hypothetical protein